MPGILFIHKEHLITTDFDFVLFGILYPGYYPILPSIQCVLVDRMVFIVDNGKIGEIYNIGGHTYFKLRDLGRLLDFGVTYDSAAKAVHIDPDSSYTPVASDGDTMQNTATAPAEAIATPQAMYLSGEKISPTTYLIKGSNYIGLRELARLIDFSVSYNYDTRRITAYADYPYAEETTWSAAMRARQSRP